MKSIVKSCLVLFIISSVCVTALAYVNEITKEPIKRQEDAAVSEAYKKLFPNATDFSAGEITPPEGVITDIAAAYQNTERIGYILRLSQKGYGGTMILLVGIENGGAVSGVQVISQSETAGLGANCEKEWFTSRYKGKTRFPLKVVKTGAGDDEIDAITSATITSKAVTDAVNAAHDWFEAEGGAQ